MCQVGNHLQESLLEQAIAVCMSERGHTQYLLLVLKELQHPSLGASCFSDEVGFAQSGFIKLLLDLGVGLLHVCNLSPGQC